MDNIARQVSNVTSNKREENKHTADRKV